MFCNADLSTNCGFNRNPRLLLLVITMLVTRLDDEFMFLLKENDMILVSFMLGLGVSSKRYLAEMWHLINLIRLNGGRKG